MYCASALFPSTCARRIDQRSTSGQRSKREYRPISSLMLARWSGCFSSQVLARSNGADSSAPFVCGLRLDTVREFGRMGWRPGRVCARPARGDAERLTWRLRCQPAPWRVTGSSSRALVGFRKQAWTSGGHRRALTLALAGALRERTTGLVNDSHAARWTLRASPDGQGELMLVPRLDPDPRFAAAKLQCAETR